MNNILKDIEFIQDYLNIDDSEFCECIDIARSTLNHWKKNETTISKSQLESVYSFAYNQGIHINDLKAQMLKDSCNKKEILLFHGTKQYFDDEFDLSYAAEKNDLGKAIYFGDNYFQSTSWVSNYPNSYTYICKYIINNNLRIVNYDVEEDWMLTVAYFRGRLNKYKNSERIKKLIEKYNKADIIVAPIADNQVFTILDQFLDGEITDKQCINSLSATNLGKQYCFKNKDALDNIKILERCYLCKNEKLDSLKKKEEEANISKQKVKYVMREYAGKGLYIEDYLNERV